MNPEILLLDLWKFRRIFNSHGRRAFIRLWSFIYSRYTASGWSSPTQSFVIACPGAVVSSGNTVVMLYRDNTSMFAIFTVEARMEAIVFTEEMNIDQNSWVINACPATVPTA
ncbi:MAG: hypothetical protein IPJ66_11375 [Bacteroidetes bacterium]|nr:hypothetical protein [Bacteroidota bacterium]